MIRPLPGDVLVIRKHHVFDHLGIVGFNNDVIHNSPGRGVTVSSLHEFLAGQPLKVLKQHSDLRPLQIVQNAYSRIGKKWTLTYNCQHFVTDALGQRPESYQLQQVMGLSALLVAVIIMQR